MYGRGILLMFLDFFELATLNLVKGGGPMIHCPKCEGDIEFNRADNGTYRGNCGHCGHNFGAPFQDYPSAVESALDAIRKWKANRLRDGNHDQR